MLIDALRSFWAEPRESDPPRRVWMDWVLVGVLVVLALIEGLTREELVWRPVAERNSSGARSLWHSSWCRSSPCCGDAPIR